jgi:excinuclease UvrABC nuclease subunit
MTGVMPEIRELLSEALGYDPAGDLESLARAAPPRWVVYLMTDEADRPVQLLCVRNLRDSLRRRLSAAEEAGPSRRVDYRRIVRHIYYRRVDGVFEADWVYYEAARRVFPTTYQGMVGFRPAWFVHVNPDAEFPRYTKTNDPTRRDGLVLGPLEDKHAAARLIELAEDSFDLCRYHNILVQSPNGSACAYKGMGKCPAPCDGSISMPQYRGLIEWSARVLVEPAEMVSQQTDRMRQAGAELRFELAARIKSYVAQLSQLGQGAFRHVRLLADFRFITMQPGPKKGTAKVWIIRPGGIEEVCGLIAKPDAGELLRDLRERIDRHDEPLDRNGAEQIGIVAHHLFAAKTVPGAFLHARDCDEASILKAWAALARQKEQVPVEGEGVLKELATLDEARGDSAT